MKKHIIICALLLIALCGCGKSELVLPNITYTEKEAYYPSFFSDKPVPAQDSFIAAVKSELKIMDEGFHADAVAAIGNTILAADLDSGNYQAVLCNLDFNESGTPEISERKIVLSSDSSTEEYLCSITAGQDGYFYVISGEAPRMSMKKSADGEYTVAENADYSGKYKVIKVNTDGNIVTSVPVTALPADSVCGLWAIDENRLYISGATSMENENFVYLDNFMLFEFSMQDGVTRSMYFEPGEVPTDMLFTSEGNYIAVENEERVKLHEFDADNFIVGAVVPSIVYRDFSGRSSSYNGEIILPSMLDFCVYNVGENALTPILSRTDGDIGWYDNSTIVLFDENTVICAAHGSDFLSVYRFPL